MATVGGRYSGCLRSCRAARLHHGGLPCKHRSVENADAAVTGQTDRRKGPADKGHRFPFHYRAAGFAIADSGLAAPAPEIGITRLEADCVWFRNSVTAKIAAARMRPVIADALVDPGFAICSLPDCRAISGLSGRFPALRRPIRAEVKNNGAIPWQIRQKSGSVLGPWLCGR